MCPDWGLNLPLGVVGQCSNQLSYPARAWRTFCGEDANSSVCDGKLQGLFNTPQTVKLCWPWMKRGTQIWPSLWLSAFCLSWLRVYTGVWGQSLQLIATSMALRWWFSLIRWPFRGGEEWPGGDGCQGASLRDRQRHTGCWWKTGEATTGARMAAFLPTLPKAGSEVRLHPIWKHVALDRDFPEST